MARSDELPDVPTVNDFVPGYEASTWYGVGVPTGTPAEIIGKLNQEINAALADAKFNARLADVGGTTLSGSPADARVNERQPHFHRLAAAWTAADTGAGRSRPSRIQSQL